MSMLPKDKNYDKKIFRIIHILNQLDSVGKVSTKLLAEEFNVNIRSIQRDLQLIITAGFPIVSDEENKGEYRFFEGFSLKKMMLSEEEASLLSFLYDIAHSLGPEFDDAFRGLFQKVLSRSAESPFYVKMPDGQKLDKNVPFIKEAEQAIEEINKVELKYFKDGKEKLYRVAPVKIIFFEGFWYLMAVVDGRDWVVKFRFDKIIDFKILDEEYDIPGNVKLMLDQSVNIWFTEKRDTKIVVRIDKEIAYYFKNQKYLPLQKITKENKNGSLTVEATVCHHMEAIPTILRWLPHIKVITPKSLQKEITTRIKEYLTK